MIVASSFSRKRDCCGLIFFMPEQLDLDDVIIIVTDSIYEKTPDNRVRNAITSLVKITNELHYLQTST